MAQSQRHKQEDNELVNQIVDYRNGRYQGSAGLYCRKPNGKGMFLDENYLFVLSDWIDGLPSSKTIAIYPNHHMFYGNLLNNRPSKLCAYKQPQKYTIYLKNFITQNHMAIVDDHQSQSLLIFFISYKQWCKFTKAEINNPSVLVEKSSKISKLIEVISHRVYNSQEEKWAVVQEYFKQKVEVDFKDYSAFIKSRYSQSQLSPFSRQNNTEYQLGYEGSSIVCKLQKGKEEDYSIKVMGIYDEELNAFEIYKRTKGKNKHQEFIRGISTITYSERPSSCAKNLRHFYKKSTIFCNSFVNIESIKQIQLFFLAISEYVDHFLTNQYAQNFILPAQNSQISPSKPKLADSFKQKDQRQVKELIINGKQSQCQSLYQNEEGLYSRIKKFKNHPNNKCEKQNQQRKEESKEVQKAKNKYVRPLTEINIYSSSNIRTDLKALTKHLHEIQQQIKKSTHQTPPKSCKNSVSTSSQLKASASPKVSSQIKPSCKQSEISGGQSKLRREQRVWR